MEYDFRSILIVAPQGDKHAMSIAAAIRMAGHDVRVFDTGMWPCGMAASLLCDEEGTRFVHDGQAVLYDAAWCRRLAFKKEPSAGVHEQDVGFVRSEGLLFDLGALAVMGGGYGVKRWLNAPLQALLADQKPMQLAVAQASGLVVPRTLISQRPADIRRFREAERDGVVVKPFNVGAWSEDAGYSVSYATRIAAEEEIADGDLRACPTTYQEVIRHHGDLRVVCLGGHYVCVKMTHELQGEIDYRAVRHKTKITYSEFALPADLAEKLDRLRKRLAIDFFCADFVMPADGGEPVFMELNPGGQFLYLDEKVPGLDIARKFCSLLVYGDTVNYQEFSFDSAAVPLVPVAAADAASTLSSTLCE